MSIRVDALLLVFLFVIVPASFVALCGSPAHAQEPKAGKVYRIGFVRAGQLPNPGSRHFSKAYGRGDTSTARTWSSNSESPTAAPISFRGLSKSWSG